MFKKYFVYIPIFIATGITIWLSTRNQKPWSELSESEKKSKKIIMIGLGLSVLLGLFFFINFNKMLDKKTINTEIETEVTKEEQPIGGDKDEGGCLIGAGYRWCEPKQKCLREWEESCNGEITDKELIKNVLVKKNNWSAEEIEVTISQNDGQYATGGAGAATPQGGGGIWFAAKVNGSWEIVWDGNGAIMCEDLTNYPDFPTDLIPECYDSTINKMVKR